MAEGPPFAKELLIRLTVCFFVLFLFVVLVALRFSFKGMILVLIAQIPGHCLRFYLAIRFGLKHAPCEPVTKRTMLIKLRTNRTDIDGRQLIGH